MATTLVAVGVGIASAVLAETLLRTRERRFRIEDAVLELGMELPLYQARFIPEVHKLPYDRGFGATWEQGQRVLRLLSLVRALARFPLRRYRKIREEISHMTAQTVALQQRASAGNWLRPEEAIDATGSRLFDLTFGSRDRIDALFEHYAQGLGRADLADD